MKKIVLITLIFAYSICTSAQIETDELTIHPMLGVNIADFTHSPNSDARLGIAAGVELGYQLTPKFGLSVAWMYSQQGAIGKVKYRNKKFKERIYLDYINMPIMANVNIAKGFCVKFGVQPGFNVNSEYEISAVGVNVGGQLSDAGIDVKTFDFSIPIGLSYEFNNAIVIDARYNIGTTNIVSNDDTKNSVFQFTLGYKFGL